MEAKCIVFICFSLFALSLSIRGVHLQDFNETGIIDGNNHRGCAYLHCVGRDVCVHRKFRCKDPPCPGMLFCARSRTESLRGPTTCDTVQCTNGYVCMVKVRDCQWDEKCKQQIARCVSRKEYHEGPASCAGFKCPQGNRCILREAFCAKPPCKLLRSCSKNKEVLVWFAKCRSLGCSSEFECFLRRPGKNCSNPPCKHAPDCITMKEDETTSEHCRGWICPPMQTCAAEIVDSYRTDNCSIKRTCQEIQAVPTNESPPTFSRRSLKKEDEVYSVDAETTTTAFEEDEVERTKAPHLWLDHLKSKTELDAIELWIKNAEGQTDFKNFQDWLRSIKDILGSGTYSDWFEEILSSRGGEFQKWLRASRDSLDAEEPIFPGQERPRALTENPYPPGDTTNAFPSDDLSKSIEDIESFLRERNLTNIMEKVLVPNRILLPPYTALESAFLNNLRESNRSPFFNYLLKYPFNVGNQFLPLQPPIENTYDQPYLVIPVKNIKDLGDSQIINYDSDFGVPDDAFSSNVPEQQKNTSSATNGLWSLWTAPQEDSEEKKLTVKETPSVKDSTALSEDEVSTMEAEYFDDDLIDLLEKLLKSMQSSSAENLPQNSEEGLVEGHRRDNSLETRQNEEHNEKFEWSSIAHIQDNEDTSKSKNSKEGENQFSSSEDGNLTINLEPGVSVLLDKLGLRQIAEEDNEETDLNLLMIQALMEVVNEDADDFSESAKLNPYDGPLKTSFTDSEEVTVGVTNKFFDELKPSETGSRNTFMKEILNNANSTRESHFLAKEGISSNSDAQQEKDSRKSVLIYADNEPTIQSFHNPPSYGANIGDIALQDNVYVEYNRTDSDNDHVDPLSALNN
ncbi:unnamed protein product [Xylocopa violacea]|uniref:Uncharacterized protein n=1 Tax=Xylocopa violacea TaxID=135666 RepID=A0ABP1NTS2_XYLVO